MRAAVYVRVSSERQAREDKVSLGDQAREMKAKAAERGGESVPPPDHVGAALLANCGENDRETLGDVFGDPGITGDTLKGRPGMVALLAAVRLGEVDAVFVRDTNRLARDLRVLEEVLDVLADADVPLVTQSREYDCRNDEDRMILGIMGSVDRQAKQWLVKNMRRARESNARQGRWGQATYIFGYKWNRELKRPALDEREYEVAREAFRLAADLLPCDQIAADLNRRGLFARGQKAKPLPDGTPSAKDRLPLWWGGMVSEMLTDVRYRGVWETAPGVPVKPEWAPCRILRDEDGKPRRDVNDHLIVEPFASIVTDEEWQGAQATVTYHAKARRAAGTLAGHFLLTGMVRCGRCGRRMTTRCVEPSSGGRFSYYICPGSRHNAPEERRCDLPAIRAEKIEDAIWARLEALREDPDLMQEAARLKHAQSLEKALAEEKAAYGQVKSCELQRGRVREALRRGIYDFETTERELAEIAEEEEKAREKLAMAQARREAAGLCEAGIISMTEALKEFNPATRNIPEARKLLLRVQAEVTISGPHKAELEWFGPVDDTSCNLTVPLWPSG